MVPGRELQPHHPKSGGADRFRWEEAVDLLVPFLTTHVRTTDSYSQSRFLKMTYRLVQTTAISRMAKG